MAHLLYAKHSGLESIEQSWLLPRLIDEAIEVQYSTWQVVATQGFALQRDFKAGALSPESQVLDVAEGFFPSLSLETGFPQKASGLPVRCLRFSFFLW